MRVSGSERAQDYARLTFAGGATVAILEAVLSPSIEGAGRTLVGAGLLLVSVSLACASSCLVPSWQPWTVRRRWAIGASIALVLGLMLGAMAPLVSGR